ncbi:MAG: nucleotide exchange factor GrpE [Spirochaetales bacterium]|nr:nucleotide exchange factor GrpE [Spirochaetales bacterium]
MSEKEADLATEEIVNETVAETSEVNWEEASKEELLEELKKLQSICTETEDLKKNLAEKTEEANKNFDLYKRALADVENIRKRSANEKQEVLKFGNFNIVSDLLVVLDDFDRALVSGKQENTEKDAIIEGVEMIQKQFEDLLFKKYGVEKYGESGEEFNPERHQAVMMEVGDYKEETVVEVFRSGYALHERVIRPAQVKVGKPE